jgi:hypothetical protein
LRGFVNTYLEELFDYEGRFDGRNAACRDEKNVRVSFALVGLCCKLSCHGNGKGVVSVTVSVTSARTSHELTGPDTTSN